MEKNQVIGIKIILWCENIVTIWVSQTFIKSAKSGHLYILHSFIYHIYTRCYCNQEVWPNSHLPFLFSNDLWIWNGQETFGVLEGRCGYKLWMFTIIYLLYEAHKGLVLTKLDHRDSHILTPFVSYNMNPASPAPLGPDYGLVLAMRSNGPLLFHE